MNESIAIPAASLRYLRIAEMLIRDIAGRPAQPERLPPDRAMAGELGIVVGALRRALSELGTRRLIERRQGSGSHMATGGWDGVSGSPPVHGSTPASRPIPRASGR